MKTLLNVLFLVPSLSREWGGTTSAVVSCYKGLKEAGHRITIAAVFGQSELETVDEDLKSDPGIVFFGIDFAVWRYSRSLASFLEKNIRTFDVVHIHGLWTAVSYQGYTAAVKHGIPYVVSPHGMLEGDALRRKRLKKAVYMNLVERRMFRKAALVHCISDSECRNASRIFDIAKIVKIPNGVEVPSFVEKDYRRLDSIAFIGRLHPIKGLDRLIEALAGVPAINLYVAGAGDPAYEKYIRGLVEQYGLQERIRMLGFADQDRKLKIFSSSLFTVIPSFTEGLSMTGLESIANSTPVLVSRSCNFNVVGQAGAGLVIEDNQVETIRKGLVKMQSMDMKNMSICAHHLAREQFSYKRVAGALTEQYVKLGR